VASDADTVKVDELPAVIDAGLAVMLTVSVGLLLKVTPPQPLSSKGSESVENIAIGERIRERTRRTLTCIMVFSFFCLREQRWLEVRFKMRQHKAGISRHDAPLSVGSFSPYRSGLLPD
jgi:hypothetical protein